MTKKIVAICFIYVCTAIAWLILASTMDHRTYEQNSMLHQAVGELWGGRQTQQAPQVSYQTENVVETRREKGWEVEVERTVEGHITHNVLLDSSDLDVVLDLTQRKKGLFWYATYHTDFNGSYVFSNSSTQERDYVFAFPFLGMENNYDNFILKEEGKEVKNVLMKDGMIRHATRLKPGETRTIHVAYASRGMDQWWYGFGEKVNQVRDFSLKLRTNFYNVDYPSGAVSPTKIQKIEGEKGGWLLTWKYNNLLTGAKIGVEMPHLLNPGPWVSEVTKSAPISLFLFFFVLFMMTTLREIRVHPMNYFFIGAAYFSFHLLMGYLVDHASIHVAFGISSVVSILLVTTYMRLVVGARVAFLTIGLAQFVYQTLFSYTFFYKGFTGLAITILCIATLFIVMQLTGRMDWEELFNTGTGNGAGRWSPPKKKEQNSPMKEYVREDWLELT